MSEINYFKVLYYARLYDKWYSADVAIGERCGNWWGGYLIC
jgi:hypothetical protein